MDSEFAEMSGEMMEFGLAALSHANRHAAYSCLENPRWPQLSVVEAAHAAELLIKARIAQEHPLLLFEQLPKAPKDGDSALRLDDLFSNGRTIQWMDLPDRLWAVTGISLTNRRLFLEFGRIRNGFQHFLPGGQTDSSDATLRFVFEVIDPFINRCWGLFAIDYDEDCEPYVYLVGALARREIPFLVSIEAAACFQYWDVDWNGVSTKYRELMHARVLEATVRS